MYRVCSMLVPATESEPVFCEEHSCCESWTVGVGATRASKMASDLTEGRAAIRPQLKVTMMGFAGVPEALLELDDNSRVILGPRNAGRADINGA